MTVVRTRTTPLRALPGLGSDAARQVAAAGIGSVEELLGGGTESVRRISSQVPGLTADLLRDTVVPQAWFVCLGGLAERGAELLAAAGIGSYLELVASDPADLTRVLAPLQPPPSLPECEQLQLSAMRATTSFRVLIRLASSAGSGVEDATVVLSGSDALDGPLTISPDAQGRFLTPPLPRAELHRIGVQTSSGWYAVTVAATTTNPVQQLLLDFPKAPDPPRTDDPDVAPGWLGGVGSTVTRAVSLRDLATGTPLVVGQTTDDRTMLVSAVHDRAAGFVVDAVVDVAAGLLPDGSAAGDVVVVAGPRSLVAAPPETVRSLQRYRVRAGTPPRRRS